jgi:ribosomal protein L24E
VDPDWLLMTTNKKRKAKVNMKINPKELMMTTKITSIIREKAIKN